MAGGRGGAKANRLRRRLNGGGGACVCHLQRGKKNRAESRVKALDNGWPALQAEEDPASLSPVGTALWGPSSSKKNRQRERSKCDARKGR